MDIIQNLDLLSVGIAIAATVVLGFSVYFNNPKSITNKVFFWFSLTTATWGVFNYVSYQFESPIITLWLLRLVLFFATWQAFAMFLLCYVFPEDDKKFAPIVKFFLFPWTVVISFSTLTPFVFIDATRFLVSDRVANPVTSQFGITLFGFTAVSLVLIGIIYLFRKMLVAPSNVKSRMEFIFVGLFLSLGAIISFNFLFPVLLGNVNLIPLGALFSFPFAAFTSYAIVRYGLFNVKVAATAFLTFIFSIITFAEIIFARTFELIIFRSSIFLLVVSFGVLLIKSVLREVEAREKLQELTAELQKLTQKLKRANRDLKKLDQAKSDFISIASHQLRTPLTAVKGYGSMLLEGDFGEIASDKQKEAISRMFISNDRLIHLVENLLNISRIESGRLKFDFKVMQLEELAHDIYETLKKAADDKKLSLEFQADSNLPPVYADAEKIRQIIINFIDNAIKYTKEGGITVSVKRKENDIVCCVADTGMGVSKEDQARLFRRFSRGKDAFLVNTEGTGLGLYVAQMMIEAHHGNVWVESEGEGKGSQFCFSLPVFSGQVPDEKNQAKSNSIEEKQAALDKKAASV